MRGGVEFKPGQHIHLIGIGGAGLSAIARVLLGQGYRVSGSDRSKNAQTDALARDSAVIYEGHRAENIDGADVVIVTSAVSREHVEVAAALQHGIPVYKRREMISALLQGKTTIGIAGTHGKTTTTAMVAHILQAAGHDPSYIVGGVMRNNSQNAAVGQGSAFVIEADEYDYMFLGLLPNIAVITNIEYDHPDFFKSPVDMVDAFRHYSALLPDDGVLIACADSPAAKQLAQGRMQQGLPAVLYGLGDEAQWQARKIHTTEDGFTAFEVFTPPPNSLPDFRDGKNATRGIVRLKIPGAHNVTNALAALIVADQQGVVFDVAAMALESFEGTGRRFEVRGETVTTDGMITVIDDYAHHPTAIKVTLEAARARYPGRDVWAVWQPHTYSRTQALMADYVQAFYSADHVLVTDIFAAREQPVSGVSSEGVVREMQHPDARHTPSLDGAAHVLVSEVRAPAVILIMSAGDATQIGQSYLERLRTSR